MLDRRCELLHGRRRLLQRAGLLFRARGQVLIARGNLAGGCGDAVRALAHLADDTVKAGCHIVQCLHQLGCFIASVHGDVDRQIPIGHTTGHSHGVLQRAGNALRQTPGAEAADHQCQCGKNQKIGLAAAFNLRYFSSLGIETGALQAQQFTQKLQVFLSGGHKSIDQRGFGFAGFTIGLELADLVAAGDIGFADGHDLVHDLALRTLRDQWFDLLEHIGRTFGCRCRISRQKRHQTGIAALGYRRGACHSHTDIAVPVADQALLGQGLLHHLLRGLPY